MFWLIQENKRLKEENEFLKKQVKNRDDLLKHIDHKCEQNCKVNWLGNPSIGFRKIKELANTFANSKSRT